MTISSPWRVSEGAERGAPAGAGPGGKSPPGQDALASKEVFLQLLVNQLRYQNPLEPVDGVQFVSQLAQFSGLEQSLAMRADLAAIRQGIEQLVAERAVKP